jgi:hypothetical protein
MINNKLKVVRGSYTVTRLTQDSATLTRWRRIKQSG